ncbi:MAG: hypothetical protein ING75_16800 [Rhodocyclaceae bacterium]|nr:hypothetical protein [Rhodocyclaceae bacterium]
MQNASLLQAKRVAQYNFLDGASKGSSSDTERLLLEHSDGLVHVYRGERYITTADLASEINPSTGLSYSKHARYLLFPSERTDDGTPFLCMWPEPDQHPGSARHASRSLPPLPLFEHCLEMTTSLGEEAAGKVGASSLFKGGERTHWGDLVHALVPALQNRVVRNFAATWGTVRAGLTAHASGRITTGHGFPGQMGGSSPGATQQMTSTDVDKLSQLVGTAKALPGRDGNPPSNDSRLGDDPPPNTNTLLLTVVLNS